MGVSMNPSTFTEGGSLLDNVDVRVDEALFVMFDYGGQAEGGGSVPTLALSLKVIGGDGKDEVHYFSCGKAADFAPSKDDRTPAGEGPFLISLGNKKGINNNTNLAKFVESLINSGFPIDKLEKGDMSILAGLEFHLRREVIKRTGLVRTGKNAQREQTHVLCAKILKLPWETSAARPNGSALAARTSAPSQATSAPAATASPSNDVAIKAAEAVTVALMANGGEPITKNKLASLVFNSLKGDVDQKAASALVLKEDFLRTIENVTYSNGAVALAA